MHYNANIFALYCIHISLRYFAFLLHYFPLMFCIILQYNCIILQSKFNLFFGLALMSFSLTWSFSLTKTADIFTDRHYCIHVHVLYGVIFFRDWTWLSGSIFSFPVEHMWSFDWHGFFFVALSRSWVYLCRLLGSGSRPSVAPNSQQG